MNLKGLLSGILLTSLAAPFALADYEKHLSARRYWQDDPCWCSITAVEMWSDQLNGTAYNPSRQSTLAARYGVGAYDSSTGECTTWGLNANQMVDALEAETNQDFSRYQTLFSTSLVPEIVKQVQSGKPVTMVGYTNYTNGDRSANQHYFLIDGFKNNQATYSVSYYRIDGYYINDPAYGATSLNGRVKTVHPFTLVSKEDLINNLASKYRLHYNLIEN